MTSIKQYESYTDSEVITRVVNGEKGLFEIIIRRYNSSLYSAGRSYGYSHSETEDLLQETYLSAYRSLGKFEYRSSFKTWLVKIMLNHCYQKRLKFSYKKEISPDDMIRENSLSLFTNDTSDAEKTIINRELGHILENALLNIPEDYRMVFAFRELNGWSTKETSDMLNISESNVKIRLSRARVMLKAEIEKMYSPQDIFEFNRIYCDRVTVNVMALL